MPKMFTHVLPVIGCVFANIAIGLVWPGHGQEHPAKFDQFVEDCISFWRLKFPKILVGNENFTVQLPTVLGQRKVRSGIRVGFSEDDFRRIVARDYAPTQVIVVGNRTIVTSVLHLIFEANLLIHKGTVIALCVDCEHPIDLIKGCDFLGDIILGYSLKSLPLDVRLHGMTYDYTLRWLTSLAIGNWNSSGIHITESWLNRKFCFHQASLNVMTVKTLPYLDLYEDPTGRSTPNDYAGSVLLLLSQMLNFRFQVKRSDFSNYGERGLDGKYSGVIGNFVEKEFDVALGVFSRTADRQKVVDFTVPFASGKMSFAAAFPSKISRRAWTISIRSFDLQVWIFIILACIVTGVATALAMRFGYPKSTQLGDWTNTFISSWLLQGNDERPRAISAKLVVFTTYALSWTAYCFYNGVLISSFTLDTSVIITTLAELTDSQFRVVIANGSSSAEMLKGSTIPSLRAMYARALVMENSEQGLNMLCRSENVAILSGNALFYSLAKTKRHCKYYFVKEPLYKDDYHFLTQRNSVLNKRLSKAITKIRESGILIHLETFYQLRKPKEIRVKDKKEYVNFQNLIGPFALLLGGVGLSLAIFCLETIYHFVRKTRRNY